jgi:hypothetical protein
LHRGETCACSTLGDSDRPRHPPQRGFSPASVASRKAIHLAFSAVRKRFLRVRAPFIRPRPRRWLPMLQRPSLALRRRRAPTPPPQARARFPSRHRLVASRTRARRAVALSIIGKTALAASTLTAIGWRAIPPPSPRREAGSARANAACTLAASLAAPPSAASKSEALAPPSARANAA